MQCPNDGRSPRATARRRRSPHPTRRNSRPPPGLKSRARHARGLRPCRTRTGRSLRGAPFGAASYVINTDFETDGRSARRSVPFPPKADTVFAELRRPPPLRCHLRTKSVLQPARRATYRRWLRVPPLRKAASRYRHRHLGPGRNCHPPLSGATHRSGRSKVTKWRKWKGPVSTPLRSHR